MPDAALEARGLPTPAMCRRFFHEHGDVSLGLVPQLLLDEDRAELWGYFWYAARSVDDEIENGKASAEAHRARLDAETPETPAEHALAHFLARLPPGIDGGQVRRDLAHALDALGSERSFTGPPPLATYARVVRDKAGIPLSILNRLLLPAEEPDSVRRFSLLLGFSIQLGDDLRDRARDAEHHLFTVTREELELAAATRPGEPDALDLLLPAWREAAAQWLAILALEHAERFTGSEARAAARLETFLWLRAVELGRLRDASRPLRWPSPLGELLREGPPTAARMAAARRVLRHEPNVVGDARRWDARGRKEALARAEATMPALYRAFEAAARGGADLKALEGR